MFSSKKDKGSKIFGSTLREAVEHDRTLFSDSDIQIPQVLDLCLTFLETQQEFDVDILLAASVEDSGVKKLKKQLEEGKLILTGQSRAEDVCGVLKLYLEFLPEPVFPKNFCTKLPALMVEYADQPRYLIQAIRLTFTALEDINFAVAQRLFFFLNKLQHGSFWADGGSLNQVIELITKYVLRDVEKSDAWKPSEKAKTELNRVVEFLMQNALEIFIKVVPFVSVPDEEANKTTSSSNNANDNNDTNNNHNGSHDANNKKKKKTKGKDTDVVPPKNASGNNTTTSENFRRQHIPLIRSCSSMSNLGGVISPRDVSPRGEKKIERPKFKPATSALGLVADKEVVKRSGSQTVRENTRTNTAVTFESLYIPPVGNYREKYEEESKKLLLETQAHMHTKRLLVKKERKYKALHEQHEKTLARLRELEAKHGEQPFHPGASRTLSKH